MLICTMQRNLVLLAIIFYWEWGRLLMGGQNVLRWSEGAIFFKAPNTKGEPKFTQGQRPNFPVGTQGGPTWGARIICYM